MKTLSDTSSATYKGSSSGDAESGSDWDSADEAEKEERGTGPDESSDRK